jgi:hypothetical protein
MKKELYIWDMNNTQTHPAMSNLNEKEMAVLQCIQMEANASTGGEFTYFEDVLARTWIGSIMSPAQFKGYLSQLQKKGYLMVEDVDSARPKQIFNIHG